MKESGQSRLLLDLLSVQGPMVGVACTRLLEGPSTSMELLAYGMPASAETEESELLPFLLTSGLARRWSGSIRPATDYRRKWSVKLNTLARIHVLTGNNGLLRYVWECLLEQPDWCNRFVNRDDVWPVLNHLQPDGALLPHLNSNRMASWLRIASWLGLVQPERSNTFCLMPTESLLREVLAATVPVGREIAMADWVGQVEGQFMRISTAPCVIYPGIAVVLREMEALGVISFHSYSDAQVYQVGPRGASHMTWREEQAE